MTDLGPLYSFGYSGIKGADDLADLLLGHPISHVVDVRLQPFGKVPFNGPRASRDIVEALGIAYRSDQRLGNLNYRTVGIRIKNIEAIEDVLDDLRAGRSVALMCACPDPADCHRLTLCEEAVRRMPDLQVVHLTRRPAAFLSADASDEQLEAFVDALLSPASGSRAGGVTLPAVTGGRRSRLRVVRSSRSDRGRSS